MIDKEHRMLDAKQLRAQGLKQKDIAESLGVTERTVRNYLKNPAAPRKKTVRQSKLDPYKTFIDSILKDDLYYNCENILRRLKSIGYTGKISILRDYVADVRKEEQRKVVLRFETEPGYQAQVDWGEFRRNHIDGKKEKLYAFIMTMGYGRKSFVIFTKSMNQSILFACHILAFIYFGGVPKEILYDNMRTAFIRDTDGCWKPHKALLSFANHYGFVPRRCQVRRPQTKGKVERTVGYLRRSFWPQVKDSVWEQDALNEAVMGWLKEVDQKPLRDFQQTRNERFEHEKQYLTPLPAQHYDYRSSVPVIVNRESHITYQTNRYSVPPEYIGRTLILKVDSMNKTGEICFENNTIRKIGLLEDGSRGKITDPEDKTAIYKLWQKQREPKSLKPEKVEQEQSVETRNPADYEKYIDSDDKGVA